VDNAVTERAKGVQNRPAGGGKWAGKAKKILFRRNERKTLLKIKELDISGPQKNCFFSAKTPIEAKSMAKNRRFGGH
jgi:hypothetical protein